jgi:hypothetical protein
MTTFRACYFIPTDRQSTRGSHSPAEIVIAFGGQRS